MRGVPLRTPPAAVSTALVPPTVASAPHVRLAESVDVGPAKHPEPRSTWCLCNCLCGMLDAFECIGTKLQEWRNEHRSQHKHEYVPLSQSCSAEGTGKQLQINL